MGAVVQNGGVLGADPRLDGSWIGVIHLYRRSKARGACELYPPAAGEIAVRHERSLIDGLVCHARGMVKYRTDNRANVPGHALTETPPAVQTGVLAAHPDAGTVVGRRAESIADGDRL